MTVKERQDAIIELTDMAMELELHAPEGRNPTPRNRDRAAMLRDVARELARTA